MPLPMLLPHAPQQAILVHESCIWPAVDAQAHQWYAEKFWATRCASFAGNCSQASRCQPQRNANVLCYVSAMPHKCPLQADMLEITSMSTRGLSMRCSDALQRKQWAA